MSRFIQDRYYVINTTDYNNKSAFRMFGSYMPIVRYLGVTHNGLLIVETAKEILHMSPQSDFAEAMQEYDYPKEQSLSIGDECVVHTSFKNYDGIYFHKGTKFVISDILEGKGQRLISISLADKSCRSFQSYAPFINNINVIKKGRNEMQNNKQKGSKLKQVASLIQELSYVDMVALADALGREPKMVLSGANKILEGEVND